MSNLFNSFLEAGKSAMSIWASNSDPQQVRAVSPSNYASSPIKLRGDSVMVYGPLISRRNSSNDTRYDVIVQTANSCFCVYWTPDWSEAERHFRMYEPIISSLFKIDPSLSTTAFLTSLCQTIRQDPSQNLAHIVIKLDLKQIMNESVVLNDMNGLNYLGQSPFHLAIMTQNIHAINYLIGKKVNKSNVDIDKNNIYHFAAVTNKEIIETLAEDSNTLFLLNNCNNEGHTPLHVACLKDKPECVKALLCAGADVNGTGKAVKSERRLSSVPSDSGRGIKEIIEAYPKQLQTKDIKNGGTPLHWATSKEIIEALTDSGCLIDAKNFKGKTALHIMVQKKRLDCALALIVRNASINISEDEFGNSPLHDAVDIGHVGLIKALLVFNADPLAINKEGLTPWGLALKKIQNASVVESLSRSRISVLYSLHAVGASQQFSSIPDVERKTYETEFAKLESSLSCKNLRPRSLFDSFLNSAAASVGSNSPESCPKGRLLSLDGGGIKGLVLTTILKYMEKRYKTPILHCFDWIAGTSTGGILALALLSGKTVDECQMLYYRLKDKVFGGEASRPYHSGPFDKLLQQEFGSDTQLSQLPSQPRVMVTATCADRCPPDLNLFRNYKSPQSKINIPDHDNPELSVGGAKSSSNEKQLIWKAARASGAAPSFFRPEGNYVDGGILSNNPSIDLLTEINEHNVVCRFLKNEGDVCIPKVLVSLGTGLPPVKRTKVVDIFRPNNATETFKLFLGWDGMGKLMLESILDTDGRIVDRTRSWCLSTGIKYHRISPPLLEDVELDATDDKTLVDLMWNVVAFCVSRDDDILSLGPYLVENFSAST